MFVNTTYLKVDALKSFRVRHIEMPVTAERLWRAIAAVKAS